MICRGFLLIKNVLFLKPFFTNICLSLLRTNNTQIMSVPYTQWTDGPMGSREIYIIVLTHSDLPKCKEKY